MVDPCEADGSLGGERQVRGVSGAGVRRAKGRRYKRCFGAHA